MKVGDKAKGFKFDVDLFPHFTHDMIKHIGEEGVISDIDNRFKIFTIKFNDGSYWNYPLFISNLSEL
jgi:hypothetical protein